MQTETQKQTSDAVLDAEQTEEVTAFLAECIKDFLEEVRDSENLSENSIKMDLGEDGKEYAIDAFLDIASKSSTAFPGLKLPEADTDEYEAFRELLDELYDAALMRVSWSIHLVVSIEEKR